MKMNSVAFKVAFVFLFVGNCQVAAALQPSFDITVATPERPVVNGQTNLPDGADLLITISRPENGYRAQDKVKIVGGRFTSAQFSQKGANLNPGKYTLLITMPFVAGQPQGVKDVLGDHGEKLSGKLVKHKELGALVEYSTSFSVGAGAANAKLDAAAATQEKADTAKWTAKNNEQTRHLASIAAARSLKEAARNPASIQWGDILANDDGSVVCIDFRAQNGFGGMNHEFYAFVDGKGKNDPGAWDAHCANKQLYDTKSLVLRTLDH